MKKLLLSFKKIIFLMIIIVFIGCQKQSVKLKPFFIESNIKLVSKDTAKIVAVRFNSSSLGASVHINGNNKIKNDTTLDDLYGNPALYVFNFENNSGFVFISADRNLRPILAYVDNGQFSFKNIPHGFHDWLNKTIQNIEIVRKNLYDNSKIADAAWQCYFSKMNYTKENYRNDSVTPLHNIPPAPDPCAKGPYSTTLTVGPLLPVTWGQLCTYNDLCDLNQNFNCNFGCANNRPPTGCVATSMAQIIRYFESPANTYNYASMPTASGNADVQQLMRDAGNSVSMAYDCAESSAYGSNVPVAFKNTFHYTSANRESYSASVFFSNVLPTLSSHWPVLLEGVDNVKVAMNG